MLAKSFLFFAFTSSLLFIMVGKASAAPPFDLDYELYVGVEETKFEIWVDPVDGPAYVYQTYPSQYLAGRQLFRMRDLELIDNSSAAWIREVKWTRWVYWKTYEDYSPALDASDIFEYAGLETKIVPVFGGLYPLLSWWDLATHQPSDHAFGLGALDLLLDRKYGQGQSKASFCREDAV